MVEDDVMEVSQGAEQTDLPGGNVDTQPEQTDPNETVGGAIRDAYKKAEEKARQPKSIKPARGALPQNIAATGQPQVSGKAQPAQNQTAQKADGPPAALNQEERNQWQNWSPDAQKAIQRLEAAARQGAEKQKAQYQGFDQVKQKIEPQLRQFNIPFNDFVEQSSGWFLAMTHPQVPAQERLRAAAGLLTNLGLNPIAVANYVQQQGNQPPRYDPEVSNLKNELNEFKSWIQQQQYAQHEAYINNWAKDKPFFKQLSQKMGELIENKMVAVNENGIPDLDQAYNMASRLDDQTFAQLQQQSQLQRQQANANQVAAAKKSGSSLRNRAPGMSPPKPPNGLFPKTESVGDTLRRTVRELSTQ